MGLVSILSVLAVISGVAISAPFQFQTYPKYQNFANPISLSVSRSLAALSHLKAAESTDIPEKIEYVYWLQAYNKEFLGVYDAMPVRPIQSKTAELYNFLEQMTIHSLAAWPLLAGTPDESSDVKNFLMRHRAEFQREIERMESGNFNAHDQTDATLTFILFAVEQQPDATPELRKSNEGITFAIASNTECVRTAYATNASKQVTSGSQFLKAFLEEYSSCLYATSGETLEYFNAQKVLQFIESRLDQVDAVVEELSTVPVVGG